MEQEKFEKSFAEIKRICTRRKAWTIIEFVHKNGIKCDFIHPMPLMSLEDKKDARCISETYGLYMDKDVTDEQIDAMYELVKNDKKDLSSVDNIRKIKNYVAIFFWLTLVSAIIILISSLFRMM